MLSEVTIGEILYCTVRSEGDAEDNGKVTFERSGGYQCCMLSEVPIR